jgi:uncharacterized membrane protein
VTGGDRRHTRQVSAVALIALTVETGITTLGSATGSWRLLLSTAFVLLAPGWAVAAYLRSARQSLVWTVAAGAGLSIGILVAQTMVIAHSWHPRVALLGLVAATLPVLLHQAWRAGLGGPAGGRS